MVVKTASDGLGAIRARREHSNRHREYPHDPRPLPRVSSNEIHLRFRVAVASVRRATKIGRRAADAGCDKKRQEFDAIRDPNPNIPPTVCRSFRVVCGVKYFLDSL